VGGSPTLLDAFPAGGIRIRLIPTTTMMTMSMSLVKAKRNITTRRTTMRTNEEDDNELIF
jgi:hypothetical protein